MKLDLYIHAKMITLRDPPMNGEELDEEALLKSGDIEFQTPVRVLLLPSRTTKKEAGRIAVISLPPGGRLIVGGVWVHNGVDPHWEEETAYAICPKCKNWWLKKTPGRPKRCPNCMIRLDKYRDEEIELGEVMKSGKKLL